MSTGSVVSAVVVLLYALAAVTAIGTARSGRRRRVHEAAAARRAQPAPAGTRMPAGHPERPGPPLEYELVWHADFYEFVAAQLAGIEMGKGQ